MKTRATLISCPTCDASISSDAPACPHCGHRMVARYTSLHYLLAILGFLILLRLLGII